MLELSLHILDVLENATRAGATVLLVTIREDSARDWLEISVEDNGPGLSVPPEKTLDPFYTTKAGKRTGLGLSLFRAAAEQAEGHLRLDASEELGGVAVHAGLRLRHVDRAPLGDLAGTLGGIILTHPEVDLRCRIITSHGDAEIGSHALAEVLGLSDPSDFSVMRKFSQQVQAALEGSKA